MAEHIRPSQDKTPRMLFDREELSSTIRRPDDLGTRKWDTLQKHEALVDPENTKRDQPGWAPNKRHADWSKWAYPFVGAGDVNGRLPSDIAAAREEILGDLLRDHEGTLRLKCGFHPLMNRWCEFTMVRRPDLGEAGTLWQVVYIYMNDPMKGYLPPDLSHEQARRHFTGMIGDYALPTREDFLRIRRYSARHQKLGSHIDRLTRLSAPHRTREAEMEDQLNQQVRDIADYTANAEIDAANQRAGSGQHMRSTFIDMKGPDAVAYKENAARYKVTHKNGYKVIERRDQADWNDIKKEAEKLFEKTRADAAAKRAAELEAKAVIEAEEDALRRRAAAHKQATAIALKKTL